MSEKLYKNWLYESGNPSKKLWRKQRSRAGIRLENKGIRIIPKNNDEIFIKYEKISQISVEHSPPLTRFIGQDHITFNRNFILFIEDGGKIHNIAPRFLLDEDYYREGNKLADLVKNRLEEFIAESKTDIDEIDKQVDEIIPKVMKIKRIYSTVGMDQNFTFTGKDEYIERPLVFIDEFYERLINLPVPDIKYEALSQQSEIYIQDEDKKSSHARILRTKEGYFKLLSKTHNLDEEVSIESLPFIICSLWLATSGIDRELKASFYEIKIIAEIKKKRNLSMEERFKVAFYSILNKKLKNELRKLKNHRPSNDELIIISPHEKMKREKESELEKLKKIPSKIRKMMEVSTKIRLDMMREALEMDSKLFSKMIFEWAVEFGFKIDGDFVLIEDANINGFIMELDKQFEGWKNKEKSKDGKKFTSI